MGTVEQGVPYQGNEDDQYSDALEERTGDLAAAVRRPLSIVKSLSGNVALPTTDTTNFYDLDTSGTAAARDLDLVWPAGACEPDQVVLVWPTVYVPSTAGAFSLDVYSIVDGAPVASAGSKLPGSPVGIGQWFIDASIIKWVGSPAPFTIAAADLDDDVLRLRFRAKAAVATARNLAGTGNNRVIFQGLGPFG